MSPIADRLSAARRRHFVGRAAERGLFRSALTAAEFPFLLMYVFGPGGVGKTALLREFAAMAQEAGVEACYLDARNCEPAPTPFLRALQAALGLPADESPTHALAERAGRQVILLDTCELLAPLEGWLREVFLPGLPENLLIVLASRQRPSADWQADAGWQALVRVIPLRNLSPDEGRAYLSQRGIPEAQSDAVLSFTHGHPLALSLVAETFAQRATVVFQPEAAPDIIKALVEQFVQKAPGPAHRAALEACAQVRLLDELRLGQLRHLPLGTLLRLDQLSDNSLRAVQAFFRAPLCLGQLLYLLLCAPLRLGQFLYPLLSAFLRLGQLPDNALQSLEILTTHRQLGAQIFLDRLGELEHRKLKVLGQTTGNSNQAHTPYLDFLQSEQSVSRLWPGK